MNRTSPKRMRLKKPLAAMLPAILALVFFPAARAIAQSTTGYTPVQDDAHSTVKDDLFAGTEQFAKNATSVTDIDMDPKTLAMVDGPNSWEAKNTLLKVVRTYSYDKPGEYDMAAVEAIRNRFNTGGWHCPVRTREPRRDESTDICYRPRTDGYVEKAIMTVSPRNLTFIHTIERQGSGLGPLGMLVMPSDAGPTLAMIGPDIQLAMNAEWQSALPQLQAAQSELYAAKGKLKDLNRELPGVLSEKQLDDLQKKLDHLPKLPSLDAPAAPAPPRPLE